MSFIIQEGHSMYWGTSRWSHCEVNTLVIKGLWAKTEQKCIAKKTIYLAHPNGLAKDVTDEYNDNVFYVLALGALPITFRLFS